MKEADIVFLGDHGIVVSGGRVDHAYDDLYYLELACEIEMIARASGRTLAPSTPKVVELLSNQTISESLQSELLLQALRRKLK
jgi:ribulose-5-phosphate 4-epimerase/fuculose-1-phosphate aldolase